MHKICFFSPIEDAETVKNAMFKAGGGQIGNYQCCAWQTEGLGQFKPSLGSNPYIGETDKLEHVKELRVEMVCESSLVRGIVEAMKKAHPYETPAYEVYKLEDY